MAKKRRTDTFIRKMPPFVAQIEPNSCWAAAFETFCRGEQGYGPTQEQMIASAPDFMVGPGGMISRALPDVLSDFTQVGTLKIVSTILETDTDIPQIERILREVGYIYVGFNWPAGKGGHVNVLYGMSSSGFFAVDPDPETRDVVRNRRFYFSRFSSGFPAIVAWRVTDSWSDYL